MAGYSSPGDEMIEEEIVYGGGEDDIQHLGEHWAQEAQALTSRQLSEAQDALKRYRTQLTRERAKNSAEHGKLMETTAALTRAEALLNEERAAANSELTDAISAADATRRATEAALVEKHRLEMEQLQAQFDEANAKHAAALATAEEEKTSQLAAAAAAKLMALRKAADESKTREEEIVVTAEKKAEEVVVAAKEEAKVECAAREVAEGEAEGLRAQLAAVTEEAAAERKRLEMEATQAALQYLNKVKALEAEGEAKMAAEQAAHAQTAAELADMTKISQERALMLEAAADAHRQLSLELQQLQDLVANTQATLDAERAAHKKAKNDWDELSRSALDEMFELRKRCAEAEAVDQQQAYFTERLKELQREQEELVLSYGQMTRGPNSRSPGSLRPGSLGTSGAFEGLPVRNDTTPQDAY